MLEVNPRASPHRAFVSKAIGKPLAKFAGQDRRPSRRSRALGFTEEIIPPHFSVKEAVFPFIKFPGVDITLGPEMRSTGEVMGIDADPGIAYAKGSTVCATRPARKGNIFISVKDSDKPLMVPIAKDFVELGFTIYATEARRRCWKRRACRSSHSSSSRRSRPNVARSDQERGNPFHRQHPERAAAAQGRSGHP